MSGLAKKLFRSGVKAEAKALAGEVAEVGAKDLSKAASGISHEVMNASEMELKKLDLLTKAANKGSGTQRVLYGLGGLVPGAAVAGATAYEIINTADWGKDKVDSTLDAIGDGLGRLGNGLSTLPDALTKAKEGLGSQYDGAHKQMERLYNDGQNDVARLAAAAERQAHEIGSSMLPSGGTLTIGMILIGAVVVFAIMR